LKCPNPNCNQEVEPTWKVCPLCLTPINQEDGITPPGGIIDSVVKAENIHIGEKHIHESPDPSIRKQATHTGILCPICHRLAKDDWFQCPECNRKYICTKHQDPKTNKCLDCVNKSQSGLVQSSSEIGIGAIIAGRYRIESVIGEGGMGTVFKAIDERLTREVAIKCLSGSGQEQQAGIERFMQEAKSIAKLSHLNIVQVFDVGENEKIPFICMELVDGNPLDILIRKKRKYSPKEALPFVKGVGKALSYAHRRRVIHRDVKPANIIQNSEGIIKLLDFGLARIGQSSDLSKTGYGLGTEAYASPEQKRDAKNVDYRTDIYSLGATIYEMLTGDSPQFVRPDRLSADVSDVIMKAMEPSIELRYFVIDEFIKDYEEKLSSPMKKKQMVSENTVGQCFECGTINTEDSRYCEKCGVGLFENCPKCDGKFRVGKEYCPKCGVNISNYRKYSEHVSKGKDYLQKYNYSRSLKEFKLAQEINNTEEALQSLISESESSLKKINRLTEEGKSLYENQEYENAEELFRKALELDPESSWLNQTIASISVKIKEREVKKRKEESKQLLSQAAEKYNNEYYKSAETLLRQAHDINPNSQKVKQMLATVQGIMEREKRMASNLTSHGLIFVEGGTFKMGSNNVEDDEQPEHQVNVSSFYISKYAINQIEYKEIIGKNPSSFKGNRNPVERASWYDAIRYCNRRSELEGKTPCYKINGDDVLCNFNVNGYRLPTEAEWEYAAYGGIKSQNYEFSGSNNEGDVAWYKSNSGGKTQPSGLKASNELGLYDMSGNVWEWCWDWYSNKYYASSPSINPRGPSFGECRVLRGGSWHNLVKSLKIAKRGQGIQSNTYDDTGFRVVVSTYK